MPLAPEMDCPGLLAASLDDLRLAWEVLAGAVIPAAPARRRRAARRALGALSRSRSERRSTRPVRGCSGHRGRGATTSAASTCPTPITSGTGSRGRRSPSATPGCWTTRRSAAIPPRCSRGVRRTGMSCRTPTPAPARSGASSTRCSEPVDVLLTAATPSVAPPIDAREVDLGDGTTIDVHRGGPSWHTTAASVAGLPALSVPFATSSEGLPIGVQLIGRPNARGRARRGGRAPRPVGRRAPAAGGPATLMPYHPARPAFGRRGEA